MTNQQELLIEVENVRLNILHSVMLQKKTNGNEVYV